MFSRRDMLRRAGAGFGTIGLAAAMQDGMLSSAAAQTTRTLGASPVTHLAAKAKRVIFLFMNGAPSHVDTFDPKP